MPCVMWFHVFVVALLPSLALTAEAKELKEEGGFVALDVKGSCSVKGEMDDISTTKANEGDDLSFLQVATWLSPQDNKSTNGEKPQKQLSTNGNKCPLYFCAEGLENLEAWQIPSTIGTEIVNGRTCYYRKPEHGECSRHFANLGAGFYGWSNEDLEYYCPDGQGPQKMGMRGTITTPARADDNGDCPVQNGCTLGHFANIYPENARPLQHVNIQDGVHRGPHTNMPAISLDVLITKAWVHVWPIVDVTTDTSSRQVDVDVTWDIPASSGNSCTCGHCEDSRGFVELTTTTTPPPEAYVGCYIENSGPYVRTGGVDKWCNPVTADPLQTCQCPAEYAYVGFTNPKRWPDDSLTAEWSCFHALPPDEASGCEVIGDWGHGDWHTGAAGWRSSIYHSRNYDPALAAALRAQRAVIR